MSPGRTVERAVRLGLLAAIQKGRRRRPRPAVRVQSDVGTLLFPAHDRLMAPSIAASGRWEAPEADRLRELLRPGMTFVDVGAHVGYMTLLGARAVGPGGRVVAVEPSPANAALLRQNLVANGLDHVEVVEAAALDRDGTTCLSLSPWNSGDNRAYPVQDMEHMEVRSVRLDGVLGAGGTVDVVKVDTQGTDHRALRGMQATLARSPAPVLLVEFWPHGITQGGDDPRTVLSLYGAMGFDVRVLGDPPAGPPPAPGAVLAAGGVAEGQFCTLELRPWAPRQAGSRR